MFQSGCTNGSRGERKQNGMVEKQDLKRFGGDFTRLASIRSIPAIENYKNGKKQ